LSMTVHQTGDAQPMQITRSFRHRITKQRREKQLQGGGKTPVYISQKKNRKIDAANLGSPHKPHRQSPSGVFFFTSRKVGKSTSSFGNAQITITIPTKSGARRKRDQGAKQTAASSRARAPRIPRGSGIPPGTGRSPPRNATRRPQSTSPMPEPLTRNSRRRRRRRSATRRPLLSLAEAALARASERRTLQTSPAHAQPAAAGAGARRS